jgi:recombinational DNA repair protein (RecF pathway)
MGARGFATIATGRGMPRLEGFEATFDAHALGRDLEAFAYAAYGCELALELVEGTLPDPRAFAALAEYLAEVTADQASAACGLGRTPWAMRRFELSLLDALGFIGALDRCAVCGSALEGPSQDADAGNSSTIPFDRARGVPLCARHGAGAARVDAWSLRVADRLRGSLAARVEHGEHRADLAERTEITGGTGRPMTQGDSTSDPATQHAPTLAPGLVLAQELASASERARRGLRDLVAGIVRAHLRRPLRSAEFFSQLQGAARRALAGQIRASASVPDPSELSPTAGASRPPAGRADGDRAAQPHADGGPLGHDAAEPAPDRHASPPRTGGEVLRAPGDKRP